MCLGGGGGAGAADRHEQERQAQIARTTGAIRGIFEQPGREDAYATHRRDVADLNTQELNRSRAEADRQLRFDLARRGTAGGSDEIHQRGELEDRYTRGATDVSDYADQAAASLRGADERAKLDLIRDAQAGLDTGSAERAALDALSVNMAGAQSAGRLGHLGDLFADLAYNQRAGAEARGRGAAQVPFLQDAAVYPRTSGSSSYGGTVSRIG